MLKNYVKAFKLASLALIKQWPGIILALIAGTIGVFSINIIASKGGMAGGLIAGFIFVTLVSFYYQILRESKAARTIDFKNFMYFDGQLFTCVINAAFLIFLPQFLIGSFAGNSEGNFLLLAFNLLLVLGFNSLPEGIYLRQLNNLEVFQHSFQFMKANIITWLLPIAFICLPVFLFNPSQVSMLLAKSSPLLPISIVLQAIEIGSLVELLPVLLLAHWYMLFRMFLFEELD